MKLRPAAGLNSRLVGFAEKWFRIDSHLRVRCLQDLALPKQFAWASEQLIFWHEK
jgi:hypothetical protein